MNFISNISFVGKNNATLSFSELDSDEVGISVDGEAYFYISTSKFSDMIKLLSEIIEGRGIQNG